MRLCTAAGTANHRAETVTCLSCSFQAARKSLPVPVQEKARAPFHIEAAGRNSTSQSSEISPGFEVRNRDD